MLNKNVKSLILFSSALLLAAGAMSQPKPTGLATLVVPSPPGNALDVAARRINVELGNNLQKTIVVENLPGVSGSLGAQKMLTANPAAVSMIVGSTNEFVIPSLTLKSVNTKPEEFRMVGQLSDGAVGILARPDFPANNLSELAAILQKKDGPKLNYGSTGPGSIVHLIGVDLASRFGATMVHVPYKGSTPAVQDLMGSQIDLTFLPLIPTYVQSIQSGKLKLLGVLAPKKHAILTNAQISDEVPSLKGFYYNFWIGLFISSKVPVEQATALNVALNKIVASTSYQEMYRQLGSQGGAVFSLQESQAFFEKETKKMQDLVKKAGIERE